MSSCLHAYAHRGGGAKKRTKGAGVYNIPTHRTFITFLMLSNVKRSPRMQEMPFQGP